jgi:Glycosyl hydrolase family 26
MDSEAQLIGRYPKVFMWYPNAGQRWPFERAKADYAYSKGGLPHLTWEWFGVSYASIASGQHDAYIDQYARDAAAFGKPILMRVFHEMNGNWYSWGLTSDTVADQHKAAWRHIVERFRAQGGDQRQVLLVPQRERPV